MPQFHRWVDRVNRAIAPTRYRFEYHGTAAPRWEEDEKFLLLWRDAEPATRLDVRRAYVVYGLVRALDRVPGDIAEAGTFRGGTARLIADTLAGLPSTKNLELFDTFAGLSAPSPGADAGTPHRAGDFAAGASDVSRRLAGSPMRRWALHPGRVEETLAGPALAGRRWSFVHLDLDLYEPTLVALRYFISGLSDGGALLGDDYGNPATPGIARAFQKFEAECGVVAIYLPTGQALVIRPPHGNASVPPASPEE